ncbi:unnamed protein product [Vitrella brassicaformis CCMP3155]|uniref:Uncharacterized protein n=1 Tax=Vitrella brassicaformis (strain CCMP3155) TaxID=1169540 RepID=A0A0G4ERS9_VITBC|nr:unnamed protein product [Vitrella brassicaformis CCMP3155]|eukprot:CEM00597.1 unnamed protein product [Vitrella brassicaformis CCMP3155]
MASRCSSLSPPAQGGAGFPAPSVLVVIPNGARLVTPHGVSLVPLPPYRSDRRAAARERSPPPQLPQQAPSVLVVTCHGVRLVTPHGVTLGRLPPRHAETRAARRPPNPPPQPQDPAFLPFGDGQRLQRVPPLRGDEGFLGDTASSRAKRRQRAPPSSPRPPRQARRPPRPRAAEAAAVAAAATGEASAAQPASAAPAPSAPPAPPAREERQEAPTPPTPTPPRGPPSHPCTPATPIDQPPAAAVGQPSAELLNAMTEGLLAERAARREALLRRPFLFTGPHAPGTPQSEREEEDGLWVRTPGR